MTEKTEKNAVCGNCTLKLVTIAYQRAPWFRLLREPLKLGMRTLSMIHNVDTSEYSVRTLACYNCIRFYKVALKEKSATFRWLHKWINPLFDRVIETIVTEEERKQTREYAQAATQGNVDKKDAETWMHNMKTGF
jgi:hypothetical protein